MDTLFCQHVNEHGIALSVIRLAGEEPCEPYVFVIGCQACLLKVKPLLNTLGGERYE
jgi:hypothetical protein